MYDQVRREGKSCPPPPPPTSFPPLRVPFVADKGPGLALSFSLIPLGIRRHIFLPPSPPASFRPPRPPIPTRFVPPPPLSSSRLSLKAYYARSRIHARTQRTTRAHCPAVHRTGVATLPGALRCKVKLEVERERETRCCQATSAISSFPAEARSIPASFLRRSSVETTRVPRALVCDSRNVRIIFCVCMCMCGTPFHLFLFAPPFFLYPRLYFGLENWTVRIVLKLGANPHLDVSFKLTL